MKSKEDLFHLIKAMSKSEKRYFTLDAQKGGRKDSKYLELFQAINAMDQYEEHKLKKKFPRNLPSDKAYLYEAILRSMRDYRSSKSKAAQIKEMILDSKYLYERGLYQQSEERLRDADALASQLDDQFSLLEINKERLKLAWDTKKKNYEKQSEQLISYIDARIDSITKEIKYLDICCHLLIELNHHFELESDQERIAFSQRFPERLFIEENKPNTAQAQRRFFQSRALYYQLLGEHEMVYQNYQLVVDWWESNPKFKEEEFSRYIVDVSNLLGAITTQRKYESIPALLKKLHQVKPNNIHDQKVVFQKTSSYKLLYHINLGVVDGAEELVDEIDEGLQSYKLSPMAKHILSFNVAVLLFILERFEDCRRWANRVYKEFQQVRGQDFYTGAHFLNLIATFESDDLDQIDSVLRSVSRYLANKLMAKKDDFEVQVLDYFKRLNSAPLSETQPLYKQFYSYIESVKNDPAQIVPLGLDELISWWIQSKLTRKRISLIVNIGKP